MRLRSIVMFLSCASAFAAERVAVPIENDRVKVVDVTVQPHEKTRLHEHQRNRVMVYLDEGSQHFEYQGKGSSDLNWHAGEPKWSAAAGMHVAEITSTKPVRIIEVELKEPARTAAKATSPFDPLKVDPKHYNVEFENSQVRVIRVKIGHGETAPLHEHNLDRIVVYLSDQNFRVTSADGKVETPSHKAGDVSWGVPTKHTETNMGGSFEALVIELKG